jgi:uncharacterized protein (DUF305 family)
MMPVRGMPPWRDAGPLLGRCAAVKKEVSFVRVTRQGRHTPARVAAVGLLGLLLALAGMTARPAGAAATAQPAADFEIAFMSMMIPHHQDAVDMANLVADRAQHAELKAMAGQIIDAQSREIADMRRWLKEWYNTEPQTGMMPGMGEMMPGMGEMMPGMPMHMDIAELAKLQGDEFDQAFLLQMRMHHHMALMMSQSVPTQATHAELQTLGADILRTQAAEIQQFETWLKTWYNIDAPAMPMHDGGMMPGSTMMPGGTMPGSTMPGMPRTGSDATLLAWWFQAGLLVLGAGALVLGLRQRRSRNT